ncbi:MAG: cupin domain-containing protein [Chloroflexaceae bacterium]|nr:cupin domain-containing protein [Chloroflexaceae bacterium]
MAETRKSSDRQPPQEGPRQPPRQRRHWKDGKQNGNHQSASPCSDIDVGRCLRTLRKERSLSIRSLAEKSGLAVNTLSLIENGKTSPSVSTLQQIATVLQVPITAFFETDIPREPIVYLKARSRPCATFDHGLLEDLGRGMADRTLEPLVVTLEPNAGSGPQPIVHTGVEFVFCLEGRIVYTVREQTYELEPGDSLLFESHLPHTWHNGTSTVAKAILVLCPSDVRDNPRKKHFAPDPAGDGDGV